MIGHHGARYPEHFEKPIYDLRKAKKKASESPVHLGRQLQEVIARLQLSCLRRHGATGSRESNAKAVYDEGSARHWNEIWQQHSAKMEITSKQRLEQAS